jgi:hypothetical protein
MTPPGFSGNSYTGSSRIFLLFELFQALSPIRALTKIPARRTQIHLEQVRRWLTQIKHKPDANLDWL